MMAHDEDDYAIAVCSCGVVERRFNQDGNKGCVGYGCRIYVGKEELVALALKGIKIIRDRCADCRNRTTKWLTI
jgi:hypothetical protein